MADNKIFDNTVASLFQGMDGFMSAKTVVGEAVTVNDTIILPLIDVSFGMAAGAGSKPEKNNAVGGIGGRMSPSAVLVIHNGITRLVNVKNQDSLSKLLDLVPEVVDKVSSMLQKKDPEVDEAVKEALNDD